MSTKIYSDRVIDKFLWLPRKDIYGPASFSTVFWLEWIPVYQRYLPRGTPAKLSWKTEFYLTQIPHRCCASFLRKQIIKLGTWLTDKYGTGTNWAENKSRFLRDMNLRRVTRHD